MTPTEMEQITRPAEGADLQPAPEYLAAPEQRLTAIASTFASSLELVRLGQVELRQSLAFGPLLVRRRKTDGASTEN